MMNQYLISIMTAALCFSSTAMATQSDFQYQTTDVIDIKSTHALVTVNLYLTTTQALQHSAINTAIAKIKSIINTAPWKITNITQNTNQSGTVNLTLTVQNRLNQSQIQTLRNAILHNKQGDESIKISNIDYNPTLGQINLARQQLMLKMYHNTALFVNKLNRTTNSHYRINSIHFSSDNAQPIASRSFINAAYIQPSKASATRPIQTSHRYQLNADVTLSQRSVDTQHRPNWVGGSSTLPPAYLGVKDFKSCLSTKNMGTWQSYCLPAKQPTGCPQHSWQQLQNKGQGIPKC